MPLPEARHDKTGAEPRTGGVSQNGTNWHRQERAIAALIGGATLEEAAKAAGVSRRTVARWRTDVGFRGRFRAFGDASLADARAMLQAALPKAVAILTGLLSSSDDTTKLRAAATLVRGLQCAPAAPDEVAVPQEPKGRVMIVPAEHIDIVAAAFDRNAQPGDPAVVLLPEEEPLTEAPADVGAG